MITLVEALHFRCLRYTSQILDPFHILVGPNASGKTTFLDALAFLGKLVSDGPEAAIKERTANFQDLLWNHEGKHFELALEARIPEERKSRLKKKEFDTIRYEVRIGEVGGDGEIGIVEERGLLKKQSKKPPGQRTLFPVEPNDPHSIFSSKSRKGERTVFSKLKEGNDNFYSEVVEESGKGWYPSIRLGPHKSTLGNLHEDETRFPVSTWLKSFLSQGVQTIMLNSLMLRKASPPGQERKFKPDGSNLPWVVADLRTKSPQRFKEWLDHVRTALPDIVDVESAELEDVRHRYLKIHYHGGLPVPSWMASDGTLRLLALTIPAYLSEFRGVYLVEEPENGIHPGAAETVFQSLSSAYDAQILLATHSPVILSLAEPEQVLCFNRTATGATDIIRGNQHPALKNWRGDPNLSVLFASGVLG